MILQALKDYYDRKAADPESGIAPIGFEKKQLRFLIVLRPDGTFLHLEDTEEPESNQRYMLFLVPASKPRSGVRSFATTFLLWDHIGYVLGEPSNDPKSRKQHSTWLESLASLPASIASNAKIEAVKRFYDYGGIEDVKSDPQWPKCLGLVSCNMAFKIVGDEVPIPCLPFVTEYVRKNPFLGDTAETITGRCIITGEQGFIARTVSDTPITKDSKKLISFQRNSGYDSYGKEQCYNAPMSVEATFAYTTALNTLLRKDSGQRLQVGDATMVFWSSGETKLERELQSLFTDPPKDDPDRNTRAVADLLSSVKTGSYTESNKVTRFYVLGMAPNSARIFVRFWHVGTVPEMAERFAQHFEDLQMVHGKRGSGCQPLWHLLAATALKGEKDNLPPNLAGDTMRAILAGLPYPNTLMQSAIRRFRLVPDPKKPDTIYLLACLIKAYLNRLHRLNPNNEKPLEPMLDIQNNNIGYRLGRLFATLEKIQTEAQKSVNATIRDRFYGAASGTPIAVFGNLMRLKNHHLAKLENGRRVYFERLLGEILEAVTDFPAHLALADQGRFAIGYYHQTQSFFTKKSE